MREKVKQKDEIIQSLNPKLLCEMLVEWPFHENIMMISISGSSKKEYEMQKLFVEKKNPPFLKQRNHENFEEWSSMKEWCVDECVWRRGQVK
jgi:hypothetical protein